MPRNRGRPQIRDLSYTPPTLDERHRLTDEIVDTHPIATAILGAAMIEHELDLLIRGRFPKISDPVWRSLVQEGGCFCTLDQKISAGFAFKFFDAETRDNLRIVKGIRNAFAHTKKPLMFSNGLIAAELKKIKIPNFRKRLHKEVRELKYGTKDCYVLLCMGISTSFMRKSTKNLRAKNKRYSAKLSSPFYDALIGSLSSPNSGSSPRSSPSYQTSDPNPPIQGGLLAGLMGLGGENLLLRNLGKKK